MFCVISCFKSFVKLRCTSCVVIELSAVKKLPAQNCGHFTEVQRQEWKQDIVGFRIGMKKKWIHNNGMIRDQICML
jgi:threonine synthase